MLEKLITNLKQSLSGKKADSEKSAAGSGNDAQAALGKKKINAQVFVPSAANVEEDAKKRNSMIVKVIVICGIAYLAVDELFLKEQPPIDPKAGEKIVKDAKNSKKKGEAPEVSAKDGAASSDQQNPQSEVPVNQAQNLQPVQQPQQEPAPVPIENINVLNKDNTPVSEPEPQINPNRVGEVNRDQKIDQIAQVVDQNPNGNPVEEVRVPSQPQEQNANPVPKETPSDNSMASKIVEEATETPAPSYDQIGRGLVYNCKDKYWACLNKMAYLECNKNMKWNQSKGAPAECVVQDIYNSDEDCAKIQKYNVSVSAPTPFCQN